MGYILGPEWDKLFDKDFGDIKFSGIDIDEFIEPYRVKHSSEYKKLPSIKSVKDDSWGRLLKELIGEINPTKIYHGTSKASKEKILKEGFDLASDTAHGANSGKFAYLSNNPELSLRYGPELAEFYMNSNSNLANEGLISNGTYGSLTELEQIPYMKKHDLYSTFDPNSEKAMTDARTRFGKYMNTKGYQGYRIPRWYTDTPNPTFEYVIFNPNNDLKPANTIKEKIVGRIPTKTLGKMGDKVNKALQPVLTHPAVQTGGKVLNALDKYGRGLSTIMLPQSVMYQFDNGQGQIW